MPQGALPFQYAEENTSSGMTALSGLPAYVDMAEVSGLVESVRTHMNVKKGEQGWTDAQMVMSLVLLNIAGGECVDDPRSSRGQALRILEKDEGLGRVLRRAETHRTRRAERKALEKKRWRRDRQRSVPSASAAFRYLCEFHDDTEEDRRQPHKAFIPAPNDALGGLGKVNADMVGFVQSHTAQTQATLDMDATLELVSNVVEIALQGIGRSGCLGCLLTRWEFDQHPVLKSSSIHQ